MEARTLDESTDDFDSACTEGPNTKQSKYQSESVLTSDDIEDIPTVCHGAMFENNNNSDHVDCDTETKITTTYEQRISRLESQIFIAKQKNQMLKDQLKKFIFSIKLLQPEIQDYVLEYGDKSDYRKLEEDSRLCDRFSDTEPCCSDDNKIVDIGRISPLSFQFYKEAVEYERKLIQVAEMHGELVEFNDTLQKIIVHKDAQIKSLKTELQRLRGPYLDALDLVDEDSYSIISESLCGIGDCPVISLWIPSAFLASRSRSTRSYHVYQIYVRIRDDEWNVYRRYSQFYKFHKWLMKKFPVSKSILRDIFPPKKVFGNRADEFVQQRKQKLEAYLRTVINLVQAEFIVSDKQSLIQVLPFLGTTVDFQDPQTGEESISTSAATASGTAPPDSIQPEAHDYYTGY